MSTIEFDTPTRFGALGRNGFIRCHGVEVADIGDEIHLRPVTHGETSVACRIPIRKSAIGDLIDALNRAAGGPPLFVRSPS